MKKPREDEIRIATEAAQWQRALDIGGPETQAEFADWVTASPRHLREFMFMEALDAAVTNIDPERRIAIDVDLRALDENVVALPTSERNSELPTAVLELTKDDRTIPRSIPVGWRLNVLLAVASILAAAIGLGWVFAPQVLGGWDRYTTTVGEQRTIELEDGSVLQLNAKTRVQVRFGVNAREVRLVEGEALFKVAHDTSRPFRVHTGDAVIRAVGTQFNVYQHSNSTTVAVLEGRVEIRPVAAPVLPAVTDTPAPAIPVPSPILAAGQGARITRKGELSRDLKLDVSEAIAWRERRLVFREETLAAIADEFNRYNRHPQIVVEGDVARNRRYGGTFDADDPESLAQFVVQKGDLVVERSASRILIRVP